MYRSILLTLRVLIAAVLVVGIVPFAPSQPAAAAHSFIVRNHGEHTISEVHISGLAQSTYGPDLLGDDYIEPGQYQRFTLVQGCVQDILIVWDSGHREKNNRWDTCQYDLVTHY